MSISATQLHTNPYAPEGLNGVYLYNTEFVSNLTLGQLMAAVCLRSGAMLEAQSITKSNEMGTENSAINRLSEILQGIAEESISESGWTSIRTELVEYGLAALPDNLNSYDNRMTAMAAIKQNLEVRSQQAQRDMIDLQTLINRRDVAFTTSTNLIRAIGQSINNTASKLTR